MNHPDNTTNDKWIVTTALCRHYKRGQHVVRAVDGIDLTIGRGDFLAVVGASGSGKSTLLNLLAGLDTPTSGHIQVGGQRLDELNRRKLSEYRAKKVGMVFQSFNLLPQFTALKNVELALYFNDTPRGERRRRARDILDRIGLGDRHDHRPADLSGGEQQRVAIARALIKQPEILFADEPTGNLDQQNAESILEVLGELHREGLTVILVSHDVDMARNAAGRVVKMQYGQVAEDDRQPKT
ncbi:MAG: ABC transporter ATP-binding protein [Candidatus Latescibacterota bacterium]|nr:MAG: ABC transporter ATP-binding protein [Candidatus Latescibacterota bacterium]